jgi:hypothetical protein
MTSHFSQQKRGVKKGIQSPFPLAFRARLRQGVHSVIVAGLQWLGLSPDDVLRKHMAQAGTSAQTKAPIKAPEGYDDVSRPDIDGWVKPGDDVVIHGRINGFFAFTQIVKDKDSPTGYSKRTREAVCLKVYGNDTMAYKKGDKTGFKLKEGQVIAMSMMHCIEPIREYVANRGQAWIHFLRKEDIGGGQSVWKAEVKCKGEKSAPVRASIASPADVAEAGDGSDDDSVPF